jgi:hypothetical protein
MTILRTGFIETSSFVCIRDLVGLAMSASGAGATLCAGRQGCGNRSRELRKTPLAAAVDLHQASYAVDVASAVCRRVLIAEDDRAVRQSLERTLRLEGYQLDVARNGREALDACVAGLPDLLILDVMMPEMDGLTACRAIRSGRRSCRS